MKKFLLVLVIAITSINAAAQTSVNKTYQGFNFCPTASDTNQVVHHTYYCLSYSEKDEQSEWVAYKITSRNIDGNVKRKNNFKADKKVTTESAQLSDYKGSGFDRGHLAPAGSMKINKTSMSESFFMSNM
ncbi:MAG: DNA/RNA non-specific endonuclease, partial [Flavobacteriales bacterium]|nr:DNA/RNA non-specific endonuclease [Flavobacteriales bacterium]